MVDRRAEWVLGPMDRDHVVQGLAAMPVPTLVIESPDSPTPDADAVAAVIPDHDLVRIEERSPAAVADAVGDWLTTRSMPTAG